MVPIIDQAMIESNFNFTDVIKHLGLAFSASEITVPMRHHHDFPNPPEDRDSTLLLMPAWDAGKDLGVKIVTVSPNNAAFNLPSIQGLYLLFNAHNGMCRALMDAKALTAIRTAATSALASQYLSREDSSTLLMVGTGALAPKLIQAHATTRPITKVLLWGRDPSKAEKLAKTFSGNQFSVEPIDSIEAGVAQADIISCATLSQTPLLHGQFLRPGQHLDMVGAYRPDMREADDECLLRSRIFVDHYAGALKETGDICIPLSNGVIEREDIQAELFELCANKRNGRGSNNEITFFKSVGHAIEDLVTATLIAENIELKHGNKGN